MEVGRGNDTYDLFGSYFWTVKLLQYQFLIKKKDHKNQAAVNWNGNKSIQIVNI
jgi:hypothetical protein